MLGKMMGNPISTFPPLLFISDRWRDSDSAGTSDVVTQEYVSYINGKSTIYNIERSNTYIAVIFFKCFSGRLMPFGRF
jgi:hypothetical protein